MLQVKNISKEYRTGDLVQKALDHVSLNLRDNEFVAILGPSGSGKTTLLNIIGGLDRYDSGDLVIDGISTKKYKDADWDSYRNHTIGFVFQSYNLIPHQTVLSNVELALTISGIPHSERRAKAVAALEAVGLGNQLHKKPNQMSGGQMQRVALARALVNDPKILLADEPTGALDSETSIQVMDLLKEVAKDRLVVMVTHNPELAHQYANRIVSVKDGHILSDTNPYEPEESNEPLKHENMGKASMSFLTALSLSFHNLLTKKTRTLLVSFAGSIGIIGIALILSLSNGVNAYIQKTEQEALSEYPLQITKNSMSLSSMMEYPSEDKKKEGDVQEVDTVTSMMGNMSENDLASFKKYLESGKSDIEEYTRSIEYSYNVDPLLYLEEDNGKIHQVNPSTTLSSSGLMPTASLYASSMMPSVFSSLPEKESLYKDSYDVKAGRWPAKYNEAVLVVSSRGTVTDLTLYTLGMKNYSEFESLVSALSSGNTSQETEVDGKGSYSYSDFIGKKLKIVNAPDCYVKDENLNVYTDKRDDEAYMKSVVDNSEDLTIVGVVQAEDEESVNALSSGINYEPSLIEHVVEKAKESQIVKDQMADPDTNVLTGEAFGEKETENLSMDNLFSVNTDAMSSAFSFNASALQNMDLSVDPAAFSSAMNIDISDEDMKKLLNGVSVDFSKVDIEKVTKDVVQDFVNNNPEMISQSERMQEYLQSDTAKQILKDTLQSIINGKSGAEDMQEMMKKVTDSYVHSSYFNAEDPMSGLESYITSDEGQKVIQECTNSLNITITDEDVSQILNALWSGFESFEKDKYGDFDEKVIQDAFEAYMNSKSYESVIVNDLSDMLDLKGIVNKITSNFAEVYGTKMATGMNKVMSSVQASIVSSIGTAMQNTFTFNPSALQNAFQFNMDMDSLKSSIMSMMSSTSSTYENNLESFGYTDLSDPSSVIIYPNDFDAKNEVKSIIDQYNNSVKEDKKIEYVDAVATLMSSVTDIVNTISYVLIAFVAISLVVSSIMIGIITYISVLERQKEIGVLRAIGASKKNVSNVFNAETFITGLLAGLIGVGVSLLLLIPGNQLIHHFAGNTQVNAQLPFAAAVILIVLSIILTMIGGFIPAKKAAKSDPVKALRTE